MAYKIFVSYPHNAYLGQYIEEELGKRGYEVLSTINHIPIGSNIPERIKELIKQCDFLISVIFEESPNMLLEMGIAMGMNKKIILISSEEKIITSDSRGFYMIKYEEYAGLMKQKEFSILMEKIIVFLNYFEEKGYISPPSD